MDRPAEDVTAASSCCCVSSRCTGRRGCRRRAGCSEHRSPPRRPLPPAGTDLPATGSDRHSSAGSPALPDSLAAVGGGISSLIHRLPSAGRQRPSHVQHVDGPFSDCSGCRSVTGRYLRRPGVEPAETQPTRPLGHRLTDNMDPIQASPAGITAQCRIVRFSLN